MAFRPSSLYAAFAYFAFHVAAELGFLRSKAGEHRFEVDAVRNACGQLRCFSTVADRCGQQLVTAARNLGYMLGLPDACVDDAVAEFDAEFPEGRTYLDLPLRLDERTALQRVRAFYLPQMDTALACEDWSMAWLLQPDVHVYNGHGSWRLIYDALACMDLQDPDEPDVLCYDIAHLGLTLRAYGREFDLWRQGLNQWRAEAYAMALHPRLGASAGLAVLNEDVLQLVARMVCE